MILTKSQPPHATSASSSTQRLAQILDQLSEGEATELIELGEMFADLGPDDRRTLLNLGEFLLKQLPPGEK